MDSHWEQDLERGRNVTCTPELAWHIAPWAVGIARRCCVLLGLTALAMSLFQSTAWILTSTHYRNQSTRLPWS